MTAAAEAARTTARILLEIEAVHFRPRQPFTLTSGKVLKKISPLARWTTKQVWDYAKRHDIPLLPLYEAGYTSIGCAPCTTLPLDPSDDRSGRWAGQKRECGIHIQPVGC